MKTPQRRSAALSILLAAALVMPLGASAQSQLDISEAQAFVGRWDVAIQSGMGPFAMDVEIADRGGKVAATVGVPDVAQPQEITDIVRSGESLVLRYVFNQQGQTIPVLITLLPQGDGLGATVNAGDGMFTAMGTATRAD